MSATAIEAILEAATGAEVFGRTGTVLRARGEFIVAAGINLRPHELALVEDGAGRHLAGECTGLSAGQAHIAMLDRGAISVGARVTAAGQRAAAPQGVALLGRVLDGLGRPSDGAGPLGFVRLAPGHAEPPHPLEREPIAQALGSGVRAIDGFLTLGRGQRVGIFAGSGVGKSTLLGMLARGASADVTVIALIGERGREVRDFIERDLGPDGLRNCVVVASTSDNPAAMRICAARTATAIAEAFRGEGLDVLLLFDSLTRVAMAQREVGLAAGEPPATRGYPPSVYSTLPHLMERAGPAARGSITALYTVLVDGDDMEEPIADLARATLDGHIVLKRSLASAGHYPPIDVLSSVSRRMPRVTARPHMEAARALRGLLAAYEDARDLISIGAYVSGTDPLVDRALDLLPEINAFLCQQPGEVSDLRDAEAHLARLGGIGDPHPEPGTEVEIDPHAEETPEAGKTP
ncbi:FliI/YscN family ATPase [bacterium]|nr:MAG: FliI/YscN family ATPase [bacterium]